MTAAPSPILVSRLEKAATDNGFDQDSGREGEWLVFASTQCPLRVWLEEPFELDDAQLDELERRMAEADRGEVEPAEAVLGKLRRGR